MYADCEVTIFDIMIGSAVLFDLDQFIGTYSVLVSENTSTWPMLILLCILSPGVVIHSVVLWRSNF